MLFIVSDLDGTLLDHHTYSWAAAQPALDRLPTRHHRLVFCSSKTRAEIELLHQEIGTSGPFIPENGGALFLPRADFSGSPHPSATVEGGYWRITLGIPRSEAALALQTAAAELQIPVIPLSALPPPQLAMATGLPVERAILSQQREFGEPFLLPRDQESRSAELAVALAGRGARLTRGGRFWHVVSGRGKGDAVALALDLYRVLVPDLVSVGLGDAPNDAEFLRLVEHAFLIRSPRLAELQGLVPLGRPTTAPGPEGWNEAVLSVL